MIDWKREAGSENEGSLYDSRLTWTGERNLSKPIPVRKGVAVEDKVWMCGCACNGLCVSCEG